MGISRSGRYKRRLTGGRKNVHQKKRKAEMGRPAANTRMGTKRSEAAHSTARSEQRTASGKQAVRGIDCSTVCPTVIIAISIHRTAVRPIVNFSYHPSSHWLRLHHLLGSVRCISILVLVPSVRGCCVCMFSRVVAAYR